MKSVYSANKFKPPGDSAMIQAAVSEATKQGAFDIIPHYNKLTQKYVWMPNKRVKLYTGNFITQKPS